MSERTLTAERAQIEPKADLDALRSKALIAAVVGLVGAGAGMFLDPSGFLRAWLQAWLWGLSIALGMLGLLMLNHQSGGYWGQTMRRFFEASGRNLWIFPILFLPIVLSVWHVGGLPYVYVWADPEVVAGDALIQHKEPYLNAGFWTVRLVFYFVVWTGLAFLLSRWSRRWDETGEERWDLKQRRLSAVGLVLLVLTGTFASVDWVMSLDPHWFSSLFGIAFVGGAGLSSLSASVALMVWLRKRSPFDRVLTKTVFHDYGKLMLAFVMLWTYFMISQYLIIWSGNLPEEVGWYLDRSNHGWQVLSLLLVLGHFALPFAVLLSADLKKKPGKFIWIVVWVLAMRWLDFYWQVGPSFAKDYEAYSVFTLSWIDPFAVVAIGGLWLWLLLGAVRDENAVPLREERVAETYARDEEAYAHG